MKYNYLSVSAIIETQNISFVNDFIENNIKLWSQAKVISLCYQSNLVICKLKYYARINPAR